MGRPLGSRNKPKDDGNGEPRRNSDVNGVALQQYIERIENVNAEIADLTGDRREIFKEVKGAGYDTATVRAIVKRRAMDQDKRHTMDELLDMYMAALGDFASTPLGEAGADRIREVRV
jgi:uncharacterized protein (UPF0335 family)